MRHVALTILVVANISLIGCSREETKIAPKAIPKGIEFHRQAAGEPGPDGWYEAVSTKGNFSVLLPSPFNDFTQSASGNAGNPMLIHAVGTVTQKGVKYSAVVMISTENNALPKSDLEKFAADAQKNGTLKGKREVVWDGHRGIELHIHEPKSSAKTRGYEVDGKRYTLIAEFPSEIEADVMNEVDKFLESLKSVK